MVAGYNIVYIFSSTVAAPATHGSAALLAVLLFSYGAVGVLGNLVAGSASDRFGSRPHSGARTVHAGPRARRAHRDRGVVRRVGG